MDLDLVWVKKLGYEQLCCGGRVNLCWKLSWSSLIHAKLIASFSDLGLNIQMPSTMFDLRPPMSIPTSAFKVQPYTS